MEFRELRVAGCELPRQRWLLRWAAMPSGGVAGGELVWDGLNVCLADLLNLPLHQLPFMLLWSWLSLAELRGRLNPPIESQPSMRQFVTPSGK